VKSLQFFKPTLATALAIVIAWLLSVRPAQAGYIVTLQQVGPNVVATGSGAIDLTGLTFYSNLGFNPVIQPNIALILTGTAFSNLTAYVGFSGPTSFGSGTFTEPNSSSGDSVGISGFGISGFDPSLYVPSGYVSGSPLSDTAIYDSATFDSLGVMPGTYEWTWGTGQNQNFTLIAVPEPRVGLLLGAGLLVLLRIGLRQLRFGSRAT